MTKTEPTKAALDALTARVAALERLNEINTVNGWHVQDMPDGRVHIWKDFEITVSNWSSWGSDYMSRQSLGSYPFTFAEYPETYVLMRDAVADVAWLAPDSSSYSTKSAGSVVITRPGSSSSGMKYSITAHAIGTPAV